MEWVEKSRKGSKLPEISQELSRNGSTLLEMGHQLLRNWRAMGQKLEMDTDYQKWVHIFRN